MLQIIGWLGCAMLAVKLLEISANPALQQGGDGPRGPIFAALLLGWASVVGFALWIYFQGSTFTEPMNASYDVPTVDVSAPNDCLDRAETVEEMQACAP